jgi:hypothetical protein
VRAAVLSGLAALVFATGVFVASDRVRVKVIVTPAPASAEQVRLTTAGSSEVNELRPPFALIARIKPGSAETASYAITVDGAPVCTREVTGGDASRIDCRVAGAWNPTIEHSIAIDGPQTPWTLEYLEMASHHGNTDGAHTLLFVPRGSRHITLPHWSVILAVWLIVFLLLLVPTPPLPRAFRVVYIVIAVIVVLELALIVASPWISDYAIVLSARSFVVLLVMLCAPRLWTVFLLALDASVMRQDATWARGRLWFAILLLAVGALVAWQRSRPASPSDDPIASRNVRQALLEELRPVVLENCTLRRFGDTNDGGYLICENLIGSAESAYSYGIAGEDKWGCDLSLKTGLRVHEYDCFDPRRPACEGGHLMFHDRCIGSEAATIEARRFDTLAHQISMNGDADKRLIVKMDVEGAEWESLLATPDAVLERIEQLPMEFHGTDDPRFVELLRKLKRTFYLVHLHFNNRVCSAAAEPLPAHAFQVLFVNKRMAILDRSGASATLPHPEDATDNPDAPDCQLRDLG